METLPAGAGDQPDVRAVPLLSQIGTIERTKPCYGIAVLWVCACQGMIVRHIAVEDPRRHTLGWDSVSWVQVFFRKKDTSSCGGPRISLHVKLFHSDSLDRTQHWAASGGAHTALDLNTTLTVSKCFTDCLWGQMSSYLSCPPGWGRVPQLWLRSTDFHHVSQHI